MRHPKLPAKLSDHSANFRNKEELLSIGIMMRHYAHRHSQQPIPSHDYKHSFLLEMLERPMKEDAKILTFHAFFINHESGVYVRFHADVHLYALHTHHFRDQMQP